MLTISKPKRFNSPLYAVFALMELDSYQFILFRGKAVQRLPKGFRVEVGPDKWSRVYQEPLYALGLAR